MPRDVRSLPRYAAGLSGVQFEMLQEVITVTIFVLFASAAAPGE